MKKGLVASILVLILTIVLSACGNNGNNANESPVASGAASPASEASESASSSTGEVKDITMLMFTDWYKSGIQAIEKDINDNADKLGFRLNIEKIAGGSAGEQIYKARAAANELPMLISTYGTKWVKNEMGGLSHFQEIGGIGGDWTQNYPESILNTGTFTDEGKVYGIPFDSVNINGVFYNKKVFEKLNIQVPQTYQQFLEALQIIKDAGITPLYLPAKDTWTVNMFDHEGWLRLNQPLKPIMDKINSNETHFADQSLLADTFTKHKELLEKGYIQKTYLSDTYAGAQKAVAEGTAAMTINATWMIDNIAKDYPDKVADIGAFRVPFDEDPNATLYMPFNLSITDQFTDKDLLAKFIAYFTDPANQQKFYDAQGGIPSIKNVTSKLQPAQEDLKKLLDEGKTVGFWGDPLNYSWGDQNAYLLDYFLGAKKVEDVLKAMDDEVAKNAKTKADPHWK